MIGINDIANVKSVYMFYHPLDKRPYIGSSIETRKRLKAHQHDISKGQHSSWKINRLASHVGKDGFICDVLEYFDDDISTETLLEAELFWMTKYGGVDSLLNVAKDPTSRAGENHPRFGKQNSDYTRKMISEYNKGRPCTDERRKRVSESLKGHTTSDATKKKISEANKGRIFTDDARKRMSVSAKKRRLSGGISKMSDETRRKISDSLRRRNVSDETRRKMSESRRGKKNPLYGRTHSDETKRKMSEANSGINHPFYGRSVPDETRRKLSESQMGRKKSPEAVAKSVATRKRNRQLKLETEGVV